MLGRVEFISKKFKSVAHKRGKREGAYLKPNYSDLYKWLSCEFDKVGIKYKLIDLDAIGKRSSITSRLGKTFIVEDFGTKYQLIWGWLPDMENRENSRGIWSLEIFKKRSRLDRLLRRNLLSAEDQLVQAIFSFLVGKNYRSVSFLTEKEVNQRRDKYQASTTD